MGHLRLTSSEFYHQTAVLLPQNLSPYMGHLRLTSSEFYHQTAVLLPQNLSSYGTSKTHLYTGIYYSIFKTRNEVPSLQYGIQSNQQCIISAVNTGIIKTWIFLAIGFFVESCYCNCPLNTPKNLNRKTHLRSVIFWNSAEISLVFCQCKRSLQSRRYYSGFWSRGTWPSAESPDRGPRRNAHYTCTRSKVERSRPMLSSLDIIQITCMIIQTFSSMRISCQITPNSYWFVPGR